MHYHKPTLQALAMTTDVAGCKPCPHGMIRTPFGGLCLAIRTKVAVRSSRPDSPDAFDSPVPTLPDLDAPLVLP